MDKIEEKIEEDLDSIFSLMKPISKKYMKSTKREAISKLESILEKRDFSDFSKENIVKIKELILQAEYNQKQIFDF